MPPLGPLPPQVHLDITTREVIIDPYSDLFFSLVNFLIMTIFALTVWLCSTITSLIKAWRRRRGIQAHRKLWEGKIRGCLRDAKYGGCSVRKTVRFNEVVKVKVVVFEVGEERKGVPSNMGNGEYDSDDEEMDVVEGGPTKCFSGQV